jgi:predicted esterase
MYAFQDLSRYFQGMTVAQFGNIPSVAAVTAANTITTLPQVPRVPVFQYHGLGDEIVPLAQAMTLHQTWCAKKVTTTFTGFPGEHLTTNAQAAPFAVQFLADRLAGKPVVGSCLT